MDIITGRLYDVLITCPSTHSLSSIPLKKINVETRSLACHNNLKGKKCLNKRDVWKTKAYKVSNIPLLFFTVRDTYYKDLYVVFLFMEEEGATYFKS